MHDGRFTTLQQVIEHYSSGVKPHPNLAPQLGGPPGRLRMNADEEAGLLAFLKTLSDPEFIHDPRFSDPFESQPAKPARAAQVRNATMMKQH
jgi:cytochrome c peroxidase